MEPTPFYAWTLDQAWAWLAHAPCIGFVGLILLALLALRFVLTCVADLPIIVLTGSK